jgi:hypothetical protein
VLTVQEELHTSDRVVSQEEAMAESKRLLRRQVQDFVKWLKAQGAI